MSASNQSVKGPSARRLPLTVRLAPQFVSRLLSRRQQAASSDSIQGLLFGIVDEDLIAVQAFRSFGGTEVRNTRAGERFNNLLASVRQDPEISPLELVGWYTVRTSGGLLQSDVQFHNLHFQRPSDVALVLKPEEDANTLIELYCRSADGVLSSEAHRWGAVRQALGSTLVGSIEVTMRSKVQDDLFLRAYQAGGLEEENSGHAGWKNRVQSSAKRALGWLAPSRNEQALRGNELSQALSKTSELSAPLSGETKWDRHIPSQIAVRQQHSVPLPARQGENRAALGQTIRAGTPPSVPALLPETPKRSSVPWISSALVFAAAAGLTFGLVYNQELSSGSYMPGFLKGLFPAPGLGLRLESQGDRLLLSWNRHHPAVRNTKGGVLQIDDGPQHRQVVLDASQVSNGSVLYRPVSDDVTFRLEVEGIRNEKVSESMRVLEAAKPGAALDLSAPPIGNRPIASQERPDSQAAGPTATGRILSTPARILVTTMPGRADEGKANRSAVSPVSAAGLPATITGSTQPAPPPYTPLNVPVKPRAETPEPVHFDYIPTAPAPVARMEQETAPSALPGQANTAPAPTVAKASPEKQNPVIRNTPSASSSTAPLNAATPKAPLPKSALTNYHAPRPLRQVLPNINLLPPSALAATGRVEVIVKVDETGRVVEAHAANGGKKINPTLIGASIIAARQWVFTPATLDGKPVPSEHAVIFQFQAPK